MASLNTGRAPRLLEVKLRLRRLFTLRQNNQNAREGEELLM
jgi:hypothetical protein